MAHLPRHPVGTETCRLGDLPELTAHVVMIKWRANGRSEDEVVILPERSGQQPVLGLAAELLMERLHSKPRQRQDAPAFRRLGVCGGPYSAVNRDGASAKVHLVPPQRPKLFGPQPGRHREHHVGVQTGTLSGPQKFLSLLQGQALGRPACPSGRGLDQGSYIPADQIPDFGVPDGLLQTETGDLKAAGGKPPGQRVQGFLDVPGGKPFGSSFTLRY